MKETFLTIYYVVEWAGCDVWLESRLFDSWEAALAYYEDKEKQGKLSLRIEEVTTTRKFKIVWPQNTRRAE
jgi:hypothetical protein